MSNEYGTLYIVATPIGNLADISFRAIDTLKQVDVIAAEDTRHVQMLLQHYGISNKLLSLHQHNEDKATPLFLEKLRAGLSIALVSDAGTPLFSDPGMPLVKAVQEAGLKVVPIPGACALIAALSAAGLPVTPFYFAGFVPRTGSARRAFFTEQATRVTTWAFYESSHRILACLQDMAAVMPPEREIVIARELTKLHETIVKTSLANAVLLVEKDANMQKGEFVVLVDAAPAVQHDEQQLTDEQQRILALLLRDCSIKTAVALAVDITGARKKLLYQAALAMAEKQND